MALVASAGVEVSVLLPVTVSVFRLLVSFIQYSLIATVLLLRLFASSQLRRCGQLRWLVLPFRLPLAGGPARLLSVARLSGCCAGLIWCFIHTCCHVTQSLAAVASPGWWLAVRCCAGYWLVLLQVM
jgi:hypothetical protein